jgi:hypothetical protein
VCPQKLKTRFITGKEDIPVEDMGSDILAVKVLAEGSVGDKDGT